MNRLTMFTFGYFGWGNYTPQLVEAVDAVERSRGFEPPLFVDIRIRRAVRARGFNGTAFEKLLGARRHRWMNGLGNEYIRTRTGPRIQIARPSAVNELLDLAAEAAKEHRRLIFFCGCEWPRLASRVMCHRATVASLALQAATRQGLKVEIVEWPGGKPDRLDLIVGEDDFYRLNKNKWYILAQHMALGERAAIPWGSLATVNCDGQQLQAVVGPARYYQEKWQLPVYWKGMGYKLAELQRESARVRKAFGLEPSRT